MLSCRRMHGLGVSCYGVIHWFSYHVGVEIKDSVFPIQLRWLLSPGGRHYVDRHSNQQS